MEMVLMIGLPASGKSSYCRTRRIFETHVRLSIDLLGARHREDILLATCLALGRKVVIDDTNVVKKTRRRFIELAKAYGYTVRGVFFDIPLEDALKRNADRFNPLDERAVRGKFEVFERPTIDEGFDQLGFGPTTVETEL